MTIVGKILVFFNLAFSLIVVALLGLDYAARTHWADGHNKLSKQYTAAASSAAAYKAENDKLLKEKQDLNEKLSKFAGKMAEIKGPDDVDRASQLVVKALKETQDQLKFQKAEVERLNTALVLEKKRSMSLDTVATVAQKDAERRQADVVKMRETLKAETDRNIQLVKDNNELRDWAVGAEIQAKAFRDVNNRLEAQLQEAARDMARIRANVGATSRVAAGGKNPPPERVEGLSARTDPRSNLVTLTIGSDAGLARGHTMEVFRLGNNPKYLGTLRIVEVTHKQAVAQPVGRLAAPIQKDDHVASRILGD
jgi:hypothetical protein